MIFCYSRPNRLRHMANGLKVTSEVVIDPSEQTKMIRVYMNQECEMIRVYMNQECEACISGFKGGTLSNEEFQSLTLGMEAALVRIV